MVKSKRVSGSLIANSPTIYILHGWSIAANNQQKWQAIRTCLQQQGISSTFLEIPGLDSSLSQPWQLSDYYEWLKTRLPSTPVWLLGHSFGGQLAVRFASLAPNRLAGLILVAPAGIRPRQWRARLKRLFWLVIAKTAAPLRTNQQLRKLLYRIIGERDYLQASPVMRLTMNQVLREEIVDDLSRVRCPVQLIWGDGDTTTPFSHSQIFLSLITRSWLEVVSGARHSPQFSHPERVARVASAFIKQFSNQNQLSKAKK